MGEIKNLNREEAIKKMQKLADDIHTCVFTTNLEYLPLNARPIYTKQVDDNGDFWFLLIKTGEHYKDIKNDDKVQLFYAKPGQAEFMSVFGSASEVVDKAKLEDLWSKLDEAWFKGPDDPDIALIKVKVKDAYYWDTQHNRVTSLIKIATSAFTDRSKDDGVKGKMNL